METPQSIRSKTAGERSIPDSEVEDVQRRVSYETLDSSHLFSRGQYRSNMVAEPEVDPGRSSPKFL
eukprot:1133425-Karenia_brevis.AAC.1